MTLHTLIEHTSARTMPRALGLAIVAAAAVGCGDDSASNDGDLGRALESAVDGRIIPAMNALAQEAGALNSDAESFCGQPSVADLAGMQADWGRLSLTWNRAMIYNLGPLDDDLIVPSILFIESMRQRGIDYTNTVRESIEEAISGAEPLTEPFFADLGFNEVGMLALEVLLFESATSTPSASLDDIVAQYESEPRTCAYLLGIADRLERRARAVRDGWTTEFQQTGSPYRDIFLSGPLPDGAEPAPELVGVIINHLVYVQRRKLEGILDARLSGLFFSNQAATLDEIEALFEGTGGTG